MSVDFKVLSSDGSTEYVVSVEKRDEQVLASCNCKAGESGQLCKHLNGILSGQDDVLAVADKEGRAKLIELTALISDTDCSRDVAEYHAAVAGVEKQKKRLARAKRSLEKTLQF